MKEMTYSLHLNLVEVEMSKWIFSELKMILVVNRMNKISTRIRSLNFFKNNIKNRLLIILTINLTKKKIIFSCLLPSKKSLEEPKLINFSLVTSKVIMEVNSLIINKKRYLYRYNKMMKTILINWIKIFMKNNCKIMMEYNITLRDK